MEQEILAEVQSIMTYEIYKKYFLFSLFRRKSYKRNLLLFYIIALIGISVSLCTGIFFGFDTISVVLLITLISLTLFMSYLVVFVPKNYYKTAKNIIENPTIYKFTLEHLEVELKADAASSNSVIRYDTFYKVYEFDEVLYLFISNRQAYMVPTKDIPLKVLEQLRTIFRSKLGKKYYYYGK